MGGSGVLNIWRRGKFSISLLPGLSKQVYELQCGNGVQLDAKLAPFCSLPTERL